MKVAVITGASGEIGGEISKQLSIDHGYHIIAHYFNNEKGAKIIQEEILSNGGSCELLKFNVQIKKEVDKALTDWIASNKDKTISIVVNNAGVIDDGLFMWMTEDSWDKVVNTSLKGMYNVTNCLIQPMLKNREGRIVNIASLSGVKGAAGQVNYSAAKGGMIAATKALAQEVGQRNITVNAVAPGFINSEMTQNMNQEQYKTLIPSRRFGEPIEVAHLVSFLVSDKAAYINGEVININGGIYS